VARVSATVALPLEPGGGWLPDGSRFTWLNAPSGKKEDRLPVRAAEHNVILPGDGGHDVSQTCTLITTLLDHQAAPASQVRETYLTRWSASETTFGEDKATITGAGDRTAGPVLRSGSPRLVIQEAWAWLTAAQLVRASAAAALRTETAAARALRRKDNAPVTADEESFTALWRHAIRSMTSSQAPPPAGAADRGTARHPRRGTRGKTTSELRRRHHETRLKDRYGSRKRQQPGTPQTPKVPGVGYRTGRSARPEQIDGSPHRRALFGDLERIPGCRHHSLSGLVVTWCDRQARLTLGSSSIAGTRSWPSPPGLSPTRRYSMTTAI
jgi:hypothetical protein